MKNSIAIFFVFFLIILLWLGSGVLALHQTWVAPDVFGEMFGSVSALFSGLALLGVVYTIYQQQEALQHEKAERREQAKRRQSQIVPTPKFGAQRRGDGGDTHLMEIIVSDLENKIRSPKIALMWGKADGLNIGERGDGCKEHQYRIAARVPNEERVQLQLLYEDEDGNHYSKFISWYPLEVGDEPFN